VTNKEELNDADVVLMMNDDLHPAKAAVEARGLFDHTVAQARYEARLQRWADDSTLAGGDHQPPQT
jgi:hypothetical protein